MRDGFHVRGLVTAATLWCAAAIGTIAGMGLYAEAIAGASAVLIVNSVVRQLSTRLGGDSAPPIPELRCRLRFVVDRNAEAAVIAAVLDKARAQGFNVSSHKTEPITLNEVSADMQLDSSTPDVRFEPIVESLSRETRVHSLHWQKVS